MGGDGAVVLLPHPARLGGEVLLFGLCLFYHYVQKLRKSSNISIRTPAGSSSRSVPILCWAELHADPPQRMQVLEVAPEHTKWKVGPDGIQVKDLRLAALEQVSSGSWQIRLFYKP